MDVASFIVAHTRLEPAAGVPEIRIHRAYPGSGLHRLSSALATPYWAYAWPGGAALARHILDHPEAVSGRRVLDLGTGSGLVAIAAMKSGAAQALAADTDANALAAAKLNAAANDVRIEVTASDLLAGSPPEVDLILVGDLVYERALARRVTAFLLRAHAAGIPTLLGDIGRTYLPRDDLEALAEYRVPDFGETAATRASRVYAVAPPISPEPSKASSPKRSPRPSPGNRRA